MNVAPYRKLIVALGAAVAILVTAVSDGQIDSSEAIEVALAFAGSLGVYKAENAKIDEEA